MKRPFLTVLSVFILLSGTVRASDFSLFGVTMGMPREEVEARWKRMDNGQYHLEESILLNVTGEYDHRDRLYRLSFSIPIPLLDQYPPGFVTTAFQETVQERWAGEDLVVTTRTGRGAAEVMLVSKSLEKEYLQHVRAQMLIQLGILLKP